MNNMKVSSRLILGFGALIVFLIVTAGVSVWRMHDINFAVETLVGNYEPKLEALNDISLRAMDNARIVRSMILRSEEQALASNKAAYDKNLAEIDLRFAYLDKTIALPEGKELLSTLRQAKLGYRDYNNAIMALALQANRDEAVKALYGDGYKTQAAYFGAIKKLLEFQNQRTKLAGEGAEATYSSARSIVLTLSALACVVGVAMAVVITRGLLKQLGGEPAAAADLARAVAEGDLSVRVDIAQGDTGSLMFQLKSMQNSLTQVVADVRAGSEGVASASAEIAQGNNDLSARTEQQASALEETAASMEELSSTVRQNADSANQANQLAANASQVAMQGGEVVGQVVATMREITESSRKIGDIISVIDGIAFQTNILALNAAVEAARAGEQGRGFAVVASEVRSLAGRSAEAAREIKSLINASVERVEQGTALVDKAGVTMTEVVGSIRRVTDIVAEISAASNEQASGVSQVGEAVMQMDQATQQNAALVEQMAAAASSLKTQAGDLVATVAVFKLEGGLSPAKPKLRASASNNVVPFKAEARRISQPTNAKAKAAAAKPLAKPIALVPPVVRAKPAMAGGDADWETF